MVFQHLLRWTSEGSPGGTTVLHSANAADVAAFQAAFGAAWQEFESQFSVGTAWSHDGTWRELATASGNLIAAGTTGSTAGDTGAGVGEPVANAAQVLVRLTTSAVVTSRFLQGRFYMPGYAAAGTANGQLPLAQANNIGDALDSNGVPETLQIWHRPSGGAGGIAHPVTGVSVWDEFAILRSRRA